MHGHKEFKEVAGFVFKLPYNAVQLEEKSLRLEEKGSDGVYWMANKTLANKVLGNLYEYTEYLPVIFPIRKEVNEKSVTLKKFRLCQIFST